MRMEIPARLDEKKILQRATNMLPPSPADIKEGAEGVPVGGAVIRYKEKNASGGPENIDEGKIATKEISQMQVTENYRQ